VPPGEEWTTLRTLLADADPDQRTAAVRAAELASWVRDHRFCGVCGTPTRRNEAHVSFGCPACGAEFWPRVTPAVIMLVHRGDEVLLARHVRYTGPVFSCVAGFVEAGETLEEAVAREVMEEVGVVVGPPAYVGSQAWPFPHSLMTGFFAPWVSGEPVPDGHEIAEARWFRRDTLPQLPPALSIARGLVRKFFGDHAL
jgi:NAD+ diphosphatase